MFSAPSNGQMRWLATFWSRYRVNSSPIQLQADLRSAEMQLGTNFKWYTVALVFSPPPIPLLLRKHSSFSCLLNCKCLWAAYWLAKNSSETLVKPKRSSWFFWSTVPSKYLKCIKFTTSSYSNYYLNFSLSRAPVVGTCCLVESLPPSTPPPRTTTGGSVCRHPTPPPPLPLYVVVFAPSFFLNHNFTCFYKTGNGDFICTYGLMEETRLSGNGPWKIRPPPLPSPPPKDSVIFCVFIFRQSYGLDLT